MTEILVGFTTLVISRVSDILSLLDGGLQEIVLVDYPGSKIEPGKEELKMYIYSGINLR